MSIANNPTPSQPGLLMRWRHWWRSLPPLRQDRIATFGPALGILAANCLLSLVFWLWMGLADSQRGDNRYGPNPKGL